MEKGWGRHAGTQGRGRHGNGSNLVSRTESDNAHSLTSGERVASDRQAARKVSRHDRLVQSGSELCVFGGFERFFVKNGGSQRNGKHTLLTQFTALPVSCHVQLRTHTEHIQNTYIEYNIYE